MKFGGGRQPTTPSGAVRETGAILRLVFGQSHGFIRLRDRREVFFHRSDMRDDTTFNSLQIGDVVAFDLIPDTISGPRAIGVTRQTRTRQG